MYNKAILRKKYQQLRNELVIDDKLVFDQKIIAKIINSKVFQQAKVVAVFSSINNEVDLSALVITSWKLHKRVVFPQMMPNKTLVFKEVKNWHQLIKDNVYNIAQPDHTCVIVNLSEIDICFVPFLAYDSKGYRLGYGQGYYDRTLTNFKNIVIGVGYSFQKVSNLAISKYDIAMHQVITEQEIIVL